VDERSDARLFEWLATNHPRAHATLRAAADPTEIADLEALMAARLPSLLARMYLAHDGQEPSRTRSVTAFEGWRWMSLAECADTREGLRREWWAAQGRPGERRSSVASWLPVGEDGGDNYLVVDLSDGFVFEWFHDDVADPDYAPVALETWLSELVGRLERGEVVVDESGLVSPAKLAAMHEHQKRTNRRLLFGVGGVALAIALFVLTLVVR
jgi:cell wall assembly regulator SMI1